MAELEYDLIPSEEGFSVDERLDLALGGLTPGEDTDELRPFGRGWALDFRLGEFVQHGAAPAQVSGLDQLAVWIEKTLRTARGAHVIYEDFGTESPWEPYGRPLTADVTDRMATRVTDALTVHDRIIQVTSFAFAREPLDTVLYVSFRVVVDAEEEEGGSLTLEMNSVPLGRDF